MGEENPYLLLIPRGVAHGYRVLGHKPAYIVYFTNEPYQATAPDEFRIHTTILRSVSIGAPNTVEVNRNPANFFCNVKREAAMYAKSIVRIKKTRREIGCRRNGAAFFLTGTAAEEGKPDTIPASATVTI